MNEIKVVIGATIDGFQDALKNVQRSLSDLDQKTQRIARRMQDFGNKMETVGRKLSIVSAGISATAGAAFLLAKSTSDNVKEIQKLAQVSNASTTEFQRMAAGARTVGIEQDKLGDILKDMNDRIGDFNATGGGPMADFFENIAPKVGVTADAFKDLSGPQALQLYADSLQKAGLNQQQMTFYMEAMASDATALLPLLANNGAEMTRLGDAAQKAGTVMDASAIAKSKEFSVALSDLQIAFQGVKDRFALTLMPVMTTLMNRITTDIIPIIERVVGTIGGWVESFNGLSPAIQDVVLTITAAFGVGGPVLIAIGFAVKALGGILAFMGPAGLIAVAVIAGIAVWQTWGDGIKSAVGGAIDWVTGKFNAFLGVLQSVIDKAVAVKSAIVEALTGADAANQRKAAMGGSFADPNQGFGIGQNLGAGIVGGLGASVTDNEAQIRSYIDQVPAIARDQLGIKSPSRVFHEIGQFLGIGLANGISESSDLVASAAASMGQVAVDNVKTSTGAILQNMGQMFQGSKKISAGIALANSWLAFTEVLKDPSYVGRPIARFAAAGAALASGLNAVKNINSAQAGGTGGSSATASAAAAPQVTETRTANINFYGGFQPTQETIKMIAGGLNNWLGDGGKLNVGAS